VSTHSYTRRVGEGTSRRRLMQRAPEAAIALLAIAAVGVAAWLGYAVHMVSPDTGASDMLALIDGSSPQPGSLASQVSENQRINILLLARGGSGNDNPNYTDTLLVVSVRPASRQVTVIALPRYLWVTIPAPVDGTLEGKLYSAYALAASSDPGLLRPQWRTPTGAGDLASATVAATIGQPIDYWVAIDPDGLAAIIDAFGGISLTVPNALDDYQYPLDDTDQTTHVHFDAGRQTLSGPRAVEYARSRLSTSDTDRSRRQELVLAALLHTVRTGRIGLGILSAAGPIAHGLRTNLRPMEIRELAQLMSGVQETDIRRITLDDSGLLEDQSGPAGDVVVPRDGNYAALRQFVAEQLL
jgi:polyisoprenyl-teichoic acid--peptidoglycan teichoic acid transferase